MIKSNSFTDEQLEEIGKNVARLLCANEMPTGTGKFLVSIGGDRFEWKSPIGLARVVIRLMNEATGDEPGQWFQD